MVPPEDLSPTREPDILPGYNARDRCYHLRVRFIVVLIACFMVLTAVGVGSAARAADACCTDPMAADQDGCGTMPSDCDKTCPHHGVCHGHQVAATADSDIGTQPRRVLNSPVLIAIARLASIDLEGSLRPPRA